MMKYQVWVYRTTAGTVEVNALNTADAIDQVQRKINALSPATSTQELPEWFVEDSMDYEIDNVDEMFRVDPETGEKLPMSQQALDQLMVDKADSIPDDKIRRTDGTIDGAKLIEEMFKVNPTTGEKLSMEE